MDQTNPPVPPQSDREPTEAELLQAQADRQENEDFTQLVEDTAETFDRQN